MTPRITTTTQDGRTVTEIGVPSEVERVCEALREAARLMLVNATRERQPYERDWLGVFGMYLRQAGGDNLAEALRAGEDLVAREHPTTNVSERKDVPPSCAEIGNPFGVQILPYFQSQIEGSVVQTFLGPEREEFEAVYSANTPSTEDLSALKKRIGWDAERGKFWLTKPANPDAPYYDRPIWGGCEWVLSNYDQLRPYNLGNTVGEVLRRLVAHDGEA